MTWLAREGSGCVSEELVINIEGERIALGPLRRELLPLHQRWINDFSALRTLGAVPPQPTTLEQESDWFDAETTSGAIGFTIYERAIGKPIGNTTLRHVDHRNRTAVFGILIGEREARGRGFGTETTRLMLDYAFTALGLHSVMLTTDSFNLAAQAAYRKAGFKEFGRRRECALLNGTLHDWVYMDCLASEFTSHVLGKIFVPDEPRN